MINNILMFGGQPKDLTEMKTASFRYEGTDADTAVPFYLGNSMAVPFFKQFGIRSSFELKEKFINSGKSVLIDHDTLWTELWVNGECRGASGLNINEGFFRVYNFASEVADVPEALNRYQRRFLDDEFKADLAINSVEVYCDVYPHNADKMSYHNLQETVIRRYTDHYKDSMKSCLILDASNDSLSFWVCNNKLKIKDRDNVLYDDLHEFEKEYEDIKF